MPYYEPVAPVVPDAQKNIAPGLILQGLQQGFAAIGQINASRRASELAIQEMALKDKLAGEEHDLQLQKNVNDFELRKTLYSSYQTNADANKITAKARLIDIMNRNKEASDAQASIDKTVSDFTSRGNELKVFNAERQTKDSIGFAADLLKLTDEYGTAPAYTGIPDKLKALQTIADQQAIYLPLGTHYDAETGAMVASGDAKPVPIWQVVRGFQNPATHETWKNILVAGGHIKVDENNEPTPDTRGLWEKLAPPMIGGKDKPKPKKVTTETPDAEAQAIIDAAGKTDFSRSQSKIPMAVPKITRPQAEKFGTGLDETALPAPDLPPEANAVSAVTPTQTDMTIQHARNTIAAHPEARPEVLRRLKEMGIDPSKVDDSQFNSGAMAA